MLKAIYYMMSLRQLRQSWQAARRRRFNIPPSDRGTDALAG